jgi:hypothetical protein
MFFKQTCPELLRPEYKYIWFFSQFLKGNSLSPKSRTIICPFSLLLYKGIGIRPVCGLIRVCRAPDLSGHADRTSAHVTRDIPGPEMTLIHIKVNKKSRGSLFCLI